MSSLVAELANFASGRPVWITAAVFAVMAAAAVGVVAWPVWRTREEPRTARILLSTAIGLLVIGLGGGAYLLLGTPELAVRALSAPQAGDVPGLVTELSRRMRDRPEDLTGWTLLGRGYLTLNDPSQAAIAFRHAASLASPSQRPELLSAYGEAQALAAGTVTPEAEAAFDAALAGNPKDFAARFYLGQAYADRHETERARAMWTSLLADAPPDASWRADLIDRIAALQMQSGRAPNIGAMVEGLAARLRTQPDDLAGWERLVRAYAVLGKDAEARAALTKARAVFARNPEELAAIQTEARSLSLEK
ncbi:MAG: TPR domain-containing protein [Rhizomicrobium sp.]